jgi:uncharacterized protein Smg (DUF494 family)
MIKNPWKSTSGLGKNSYFFRAPSYGFAAFLLVIHHLENRIPWTTADYLSLSFTLLIPHIFLIWYNLSGNNKGLAIRQIGYDFFFAGWFAGSIGLSILPSFMYILSVTTNYIAVRGIHRLYRISYLGLGLLIALWLENFNLHPEFTPYMTFLSLGYAVFHFCSLSFISYMFAAYQFHTKKLVKNQKEEIDQQREEISMQSEELQALNESLQQLNNNLEKKVEARTEELKRKNEQLSKYAFFNAHRLRAPVATILGLLQFMDYKNVLKKHQNEIFNRLKMTAEDLDFTVTEIKEMLETESDELEELEFYDKQELKSSENT